MHRKVLSPILTVAIAFLLSAVILGITSRQPRETLRWFFLGPFSNFYFFGNMLAASIPLMFTGLAACLAFSAGMFNLGLEGQHYFGAIIGTIVALSVPTSSVSSMFLALAVSFLVGALLALVPMLLRLTLGFSELISSFMIGQVFIYVGDFLLNGLFRDPEAALAATRHLDETVVLAKILPPSNLHAGYVVAIALCLMFTVVRKWFVMGYEFKMVRENPRFAKIHGMDVERIWLLAMILSGGVAALGGMVEVLGVYGRAVKGFSHGNGFNGIAVSLLVRNNPALIFLSALFFAYLESGAEIASLMVQTPAEIVRLVQGIVFCLVTAEFLFSRGERDADSVT
ncbi:MAG: ABC transporter permease [Pseudothermotoga sp.]|uniref:ABC transporter permease n=1 Tax=Pseudothermotoga sp. TaxID=2033661 RepID=UPI0019909633|nr:ABC transporter permease [Pseudothermotoga sp.]